MNPQILSRSDPCPNCKQPKVYVIQHDNKLIKSCQACYFRDPPLLRPLWQRFRITIGSGFGVAITPSITFYSWKDRGLRYTDWDVVFQFWKFAIIVGIKAL